MKKNLITGIALLICAALTGCSDGDPANSAPISVSKISRQSSTDSIGLNGRWRLVNITDSGRSRKPTTTDTLIVENGSSIERHSGGQLVSKDEFRLFKMTNYCADYQLVYKNDSIGCINIYKDTLIFSECSNQEAKRYFFKKIQG